MILGRDLTAGRGHRLPFFGRPDGRLDGPSRRPGQSGADRGGPGSAGRGRGARPEGGPPIAPLPDRRGPSPPPLWSDGRFRIRLIGPDGPPLIATVGRPYAVLGRAADADLPIRSPEASLRHAYLHLDARGLFAVDLASRRGTRFDEATAGARSCWLRPGRGLEVAGHRLELIDADPPIAGPPAGPRPDPLTAAGPGLPVVELIGDDPDAAPLRPLSELAFVGRARSVAVRLEDRAVARVHALLVRSTAGAFLVDLVGENLLINERPPAAPALPLADGDELQVGRHRFLVRVRPAPGPAPALGVVEATGSLPEVVARHAPAAPPELRDALAAWATEAVRGTQQELARQQGQFQQAMLAAVRQLYQDQATLFERHLERIDRLQQELAELRAELRGRLGTDPPASPDALPAPPAPAPGPEPVTTGPGPDAPDQGRATSWLLDRVRTLEDQVEQETRSTWRDLLARLGGGS